MRLTTFIATAVLVLTTALPASAAYQSNGRVSLLTRESAAVFSGESVWVTFNWTARGGEVSNFAATVTAGDGVEVEYPENTGTFTGLMDGHYLSVGERDFTAVKVTVPYSVDEEVDLRFTVTYTDGRGRDRTQRFRAELSVEPFEERATVTQLDSINSVASGAGSWVDVDYTTRAPRADDLQMVITDTAGLDVHYPGYGSATMLHHDHRLNRGETDTARFYVNTEGVVPGDYVLQTETTYEMDGRTRTLAGKVLVTVTG